MAVKVSFVIPLYNCLPHTQVMLVSLQATLPHGLEHEIILVDDGSTDGTREWLATLAPPFRLLLNKRNLGYAAANNRAAAAATGEILVFLNNDLVLTPRWLEPMLAAHRRIGSHAGPIGNVQLDARTGAVDHAGMIVNLKGKPEHIRALPPHWLCALFPVRRAVAVTGACLLLERSLWLQLGGFDEQFVNGCEDVDLCFRARQVGRVTAVALRSLARHHVSASPGRKLHNEENSRRLAAKWRSELAEHAARRWCWHYLDRAWTSPHAATDHAAARQALCYALHLRRKPPTAALDGMRSAIDREFSRWQQILPSSAA